VEKVVLKSLDKVVQFLAFHMLCQEEFEVLEGDEFYVVVLVPCDLAGDIVDVINSKNLKSLNKLILRDPPHAIHIIKLYQLGRQLYLLLQVLLLYKLNSGRGQLHIRLQRYEFNQLREHILLLCLLSLPCHPGHIINF
jgi:hypothetical protein